jgi:hypothetical protein
MCRNRFTRAGLGLAALALATGCSRQPETLTPEASRAKGDELLRQMSRTLATAQAFSYRAEQSIERVRGGGERVTEQFSQLITVRRPNQVAFTEQGADRDVKAWYDGTRVTLVANRQKVWVRGPMPATLDEAMDFVSAEYDVKLPTADLLYSSPYDALITPDTTGGWVNVENVGNRSCDHLSYQQPVVDWQIWLTQDERRLPCQLQITYKTDPGQPVTRVVFFDWNPSPTIADATFQAVIPDGYNRIKLMRHATLTYDADKEKGK